MLAVNDCLMMQALSANTNKLIADAVWHTVRQGRYDWNLVVLSGLSARHASQNFW